MTAEEARLFQVLDDYSRSHHQHFLAEMFLNESKTGYVLCFRPVAAERGSSSRYDCRYMQITAEEAVAAQTGGLSLPMRSRLDKGLLHDRESG